MVRVWIIDEEGICHAEFEIGSSFSNFEDTVNPDRGKPNFVGQMHSPVPHPDRSELDLEALNERRELALRLLRFPEGSFAHAFLEAYIRADLANQRLLSDDFDVLRKKFHWDGKAALVEAGEK